MRRLSSIAIARSCLAAVVSVLLLCGTAAAQTYIPTQEEYRRILQALPEDCAQAEQILETGPAAERFGWALFQIRVCPEMGPAIAALLRDLSTTTDPTGALEDVIQAMLGTVDSAIYAAAFDVVRSPSASIEVKLQNLRVLHTQLSPGARDSYETFASDTMPPPGAFGHGFQTLTPLPADAGTQVAQAMEVVLTDPATDDRLRRAAGFVWRSATVNAECLPAPDFSACVRDLPPVPVPPADPAAISMQYDCDNWFVIENGNPRGVIVTARIPGKDYERTFGVPAGGEFRLYTMATGTVELLLEGAVIQTVPNGGVACSVGEPKGTTPST